jgi:hypothetical protein
LCHDANRKVHKISVMTQELALLFLKQLLYSTIDKLGIHDENNNEELM